MKKWEPSKKEKGRKQNVFRDTASCLPILFWPLMLPLIAGQNLPTVARKGGEGKDKEKTAGAAHPARAVLTPPTTGEAIKNKLITKKLSKMKRLSKLSINPSKVMKNKELVNLKGGEGVNCYCKDALGYTHYTGSIPDCSTAIRWIQNNCWPDHQATSHCDCAPIANL